MVKVGILVQVIIDHLFLHMIVTYSFWGKQDAKKVRTKSLQPVG